MEQQPQPTSLPAEQQEESIFDEELLISPEYDRHVRRARNAIFFVAGAQVVLGLLQSFVGPDELFMYSLIESLIVAAIFAGLGFWARKDPYPAILAALLFYCALILLYAAIEPVSIARGIIVKIIIIVYLARGLKNARRAQLIKEALGKK